ncbi:Type IV fimbrial biogenesis protein PilW [Psychrobacter nivimaris]|uniref:Type IV fimbrial biogenesis protein PilW n=1 Tax=Psychrobacter nivimaris TaxID=281738 RepID=A0A6N7C343_9GAMM|nr:PilW family protein [Psychrobacter nivimaris]KAF0569772.1 Type IV fimbrial biogenesis protein PilW [Psychrobacter nivimaris]
MKSDIPINIRYHQGFTLIELMISLVLGLLISAAVIQVFITSQRVDRIQNAGSEIQDSAIFGLQGLEYQLRLANLGNDGVPLNDKTTIGGVVLTSSDDDTDLVNVLTTNELKDGFLTRSHDMSSTGNKDRRWNGLTNTDVASDQLTIQYTNTTGQVLQDCEGKNVEVNEHVITRYFIAEDDNKTGLDRKNLNLNCDAGRIEKKNDTEYEHQDFGDIGQTVIRNVDQFNIRLGVKQEVPTAGGGSSYEYRDMTVKQYMDLTTDKPFITNIKLAILARSTANSPVDSNNKFDIFGVEQTLKPQTDAPNYLRRVYTTNTLLRNARIVNIIRS